MAPLIRVMFDVGYFLEFFSLKFDDKTLRPALSRVTGFAGGEILMNQAPFEGISSQ